MFCIDCGTELPDRARFCLECGEPQTPKTDTMTTVAAGDARVKAQSEQTSPTHLPSASSPPQLLKRSRNRHTIGVLLLGTVVVGGGIAWAFAEVVTKNRQHALDVINIMSILLGIVGSLYLGYDLLGRQYGPLRWLTQFISCGLMGALVFGPLVWLAKGHRAPVAIVGGILGAFSGILIGISNEDTEPPGFSHRGFWIGGVVGVLFWFTLFFAFLTGTGNISNVAIDLRNFLIWGVILPPLGGFLGGYRKFIYHEPPGSAQYFFSWRGCLHGFVNGFVIGLVLWYVFGGFFVVAPPGGIIAGIIIAVGSAIAGGTARFIFNWANELPENVLGTFGLVLIMFAAVLQFTQPMFDLISSAVK
jgi:hypothetical protein